MTEMKVTAKAAVVGDLSQVLPQLRLGWVGLAPVWLQRERVGVEIRLNVAPAAGIDIVPPRPADIVGALEHGQVDVPCLHQLDGSAETSETGADDQEVNRLRFGLGGGGVRRAGGHWRLLSWQHEKNGVYRS